jgi:inorganic triphosphatase YgiF
MSQVVVGLRFLVPPAARAGIVSALERGSSTLDRTTLAAMYLDTDDRRLARAGMAWRLRREARRWIQTVTAVGSNALERFEHKAIRPDASPEASAHAGTPLGDRLIGLLRRARADGLEPGVRFRTEVRRTARRIRTRGALVEVAFDEGRLVAADASRRIRELEFELVSGSPMAMLALAERWRKRFALVCDPRSKAERGDHLADGLPFPPVRKADRPSYTDEATATEAFGLVLDECLAHIIRNAVGLTEGDSSQGVEHVHQLRVGIRRLRSALRSFQGWVPTPPADLVAGLRSLFSTLGSSRDSEVLASGVVAELAKAGAPPLTLPPGRPGPDPADAVKAADTQHNFLAWVAWRAALAPAPAVAAAEPAAGNRGEQPAAADAAGSAEAGSPDAAAEHTGKHPTITAEPAADDDPRLFHRKVSRRLRRWHARIVVDWKSFDDLDDAGLHALRKRIKRQRYAVEFFSPLLRRRQVERYLESLAAIQDRMGALNDLFVARTRYQSLGSLDPAVWFALGWLTARIAELRALAKPELARLAKAEPPAP